MRWLGLRSLDGEMRIGQLKRGQVVSGTVSRLEDYGAVVDLGQCEGLVDNAHLSWIPGKLPNEVLRVGEVVKVVVVRIDGEAGEVTLSVRDLQQDPLLDFARNLYGGTVMGVIDKVSPIGVFVKIEDGFIGLIPGDPREIERRIYETIGSGTLVNVRVSSVNVFSRQIELEIAASTHEPEGQGS
jgi:ribosomal protein S1